MPGRHYTAKRQNVQGPEYDFYARTGELMPGAPTARNGDKLLQYDTGRQYVFFRGGWYAEPSSPRDMVNLLEEIRDELTEYQRPMAEAFLDRL